MLDTSFDTVRFEFPTQLIAAVVIGYLIYRLFLAVLGPIRRGFAAVERDDAHRLAAARRELSATRTELDATRVRLAGVEGQLRSTTEALDKSRVARSSLDGELRRALRQLDTLETAYATPLGQPSTVTTTVAAPEATEESSALVADRAPVIADLFGRVLPRLLQTEEERFRSAAAEHLKQRETHLHRFTLPFEEIPLILRTLSAGQLAAFATALAQLNQTLADPQARAIVEDRWLEQPERTDLLRRLGATTGVDPTLEPALVTLVGRYSPVELRKFAQRLEESVTLATALTTARVANDRAGELIAQVWRETAGNAPLEVTVSPELIGGLVLTSDLTYQDESWAHAALSAGFDDEGESHG
ncbi:F0F1 ATP synthase subunit delta [Cellulomonas sp. NPDC089187]|uniref:F0F1 ATP synthase subunit delta n=1 Tax=Cellulomonas sp. NPDC089187 TaxID=3154970 RepID=UPI00341BB5ED